jgi:PAS domain S-box-containing protein
MDKLFSLFAKSSDAAFAVDTDQRILYWNHTAEYLTGYSAEEALGQLCWEFLRGVTKECGPVCAALCPVIRQIKTGKAVCSMDMAIRGQSGLSIPINMSTIPVGPEYSNGAKPFLIHLMRPLEKPESQFGALRLYMLGPLRVQRLDGSIVNSAYWQNPDVRALLVLLAQTYPMIRHEQELAAALWPELPGSLAISVLETAVTHLRLSLEPELDDPQNSVYIQQEASGYRLNRDIPLWRDLDYVAIQLEQARLEPNPRRAKTSLQELLLLFRGDYLADLSRTAVWAADRYLVAQKLHLCALETTGDLLQQLGQPQEAKKLYLSALMVDPDYDSAYQKLIHLALPHGSKIEALAYCQRLAATLRSELDIMLDAEFRELLQET